MAVGEPVDAGREHRRRRHRRTSPAIVATDPLGPSGRRFRRGVHPGALRRRLTPPRLPPRVGAAATVAVGERPLVRAAQAAVAEGKAVAQPRRETVSDWAQSTEPAAVHLPSWRATTPGATRMAIRRISRSVFARRR